MDLPVEIVELILVACDAKVLAVAIPRVSKLFKKLSGDNSLVWKAKCEQKCLGWNSKAINVSWKRNYFDTPLKLFPLFGFTLTETTHQELKDAPGAVANKSGTTDYVAFRHHNLWVIDGLFNMMYLTYTDTLPQEWIDQGLTFDISWLELKELLRKKVGNYKVTRKPHNSTFQDKECFSAQISTVVQEEIPGSRLFYYQMSFNFSYHVGTESSPKTLYGITMRGDDLANSRSFKNTYEQRQCAEE